MIKKWPKDWNEHITKSCELYFENKEINFLEYNLYNSSMPDNKGEIKRDTYRINIEFEYNGEYYITSITYYKKIFSINYFYKNYDLKQILDFNNSKLVLSIDGYCAGNDIYGIYTYDLISGQSSFNETPFDIIKYIENTILNHKKDDDNDDNRNKDKDPIVPINSDEVNPILNF